MYLREPHVAALAFASFALVCSTPAVRAEPKQAERPVKSAAPPTAGRPFAPANELDAFMERVLARREVNRKTLEQYILDETEAFEILAPGRTPMYRTRREYSWYVRDGMHVRSPIRFNGVSIGEDARVRYEENWIKAERERRARKAQQARDEPQGKMDGAEKDQDNGEISISNDGLHVSGATVPTEPRFVSEAYFMDFKFEPGNYYLAGRETLEGQEVLRIEYYPTKLFGDDDKKHDKTEAKPAAAAGESRSRNDDGRSDRERDGRSKDLERDIERKMNKTALITLWIDPKEHQIVKYTFDNVWLDFLPGAWLVRVDDTRASMTMGQPFPGVWLPRGIDIHAGVTLANGSFEASYERAFSQYRLAEVETKIRIPKVSDASAAPVDRAYAGSRPIAPVMRPCPVQILGNFGNCGNFGNREDTSPIAVETNRASTADLQMEADPGPRSGPFVEEQAGQASAEVVHEIRVHGNAFLTDQEVLALAGLRLGEPLPAEGIDAVAKRLKDSGRFETVDVRKRYRSLTGTSDVALVLVVHERPGVRSGGTSPSGTPLPPIGGPMSRLRSQLMFLPIVTFADGYGFTYGGRTSTVDLLGAGERLSVPLTWGGTRRAALEFERLFKTGPLTRIESSVAIWNRENPRFDIRDQRVEVQAGAERVFADVLRTRVSASRSTIEFGAVDDRLWTVGTSVALDTRLDPAFPGNAILLGAGWTGLHFREVPGRVNRYTAEARGYLRVFRQAVLAGRALYTGADTALPPYERLLLGGSGSLRGFRTGTFDGDRTLTTSAELRVPLTSVLNGAKLGVTAFMDAGKVWSVGESMDAAPWHRGVGGGVFLIASVVRLNLDIARGLKTGGTRVHLSTGFAF